MMGYSTVTHNLWCVTANLEVNYRSPCPVQEEFELSAWVTRIEDKKIYTESTIISGENIHVESSGLFINLGQDRAQKFFIADKNYP